jgi:hypothetical protein
VSIPIDYVRTNQVRLAAQQLRAAIHAPEARRAKEIREATDWLVSAADQHENDAARARQGFMAETTAPQSEQTKADVMLVVISDLYVANTLMAAGHALQETEAPPDPKLLDQALIGLHQSATVDQETIRAFAFTSTPVHSADLPSARDTFRERTGEALAELVSQSKDACSGAIAGLKKLDPQNALDALGQLGGPLAELPKLGVLFRKGVEKLENALDFLKNMLDSAGLGEIKKKLTEFWDKIMDGTWADGLLDWIFSLGAVKALLPSTAASDRFTVDEVDRATGNLAPVVEKFTGEMKWAKALAAAIGFAGPLLLAATHVTAGMSAVFLGGAYILILAAIIAMGRDSAGSGAWFHSNRGVRAIVERLIAA